MSRVFYQNNLITNIQSYWVTENQNLFILTPAGQLFGFDAKRAPLYQPYLDLSSRNPRQVCAYGDFFYLLEGTTQITKFRISTGAPEGVFLTESPDNQTISSFTLCHHLFFVTFSKNDLLLPSLAKSAIYNLRGQCVTYIDSMMPHGLTSPTLISAFAREPRGDYTMAIYDRTIQKVRLYQYNYAQRSISYLTESATLPAEIAMLSNDATQWYVEMRVYQPNITYTLQGAAIQTTSSQVPAYSPDYHQHAYNGSLLQKYPVLFEDAIKTIFLTSDTYKTILLQRSHPNPMGFVLYDHWARNNILVTPPMYRLVKEKVHLQPPVAISTHPIFTQEPTLRALIPDLLQRRAIYTTIGQYMAEAEFMEKILQILRQPDASTSTRQIHVSIPADALPPLSVYQRNKSYLTKVFYTLYHPISVHIE